ncbi:UDP-N-acetylmuramoyl-L-alanine--D-glutamate ligase [Thiomicrorhabdus indica]|uniref:UDP-N-acetylmuramoyl-L-alanine--D-glutamate ligase n=1 Tax=Thiomicrorhabdus indica TaxID=2267253 RepID=UPI00102D9424|nr:UDP-N-acetylmuramoyl-L-alanine--D-glutamate ligase [Thiomicrorhabdus indica]
MYLVAGLGVTGHSVLQYLQLNKEKALAFDTREGFDFSGLKAQFPDVDFATGQIPKKWLSKITTVVLSPGICVREPWVQSFMAKGIQIVGDIELFARAVGVPVVAITGSNGKSTVTTLVGMALEEAGYSVGVGGNIGVPALDLLSDDNEYEVYVLELSSFQLETTYSLHTISSALLNLSEDHMDRYDDMNAYLQAKLNVYNDTALAVCPFDLECDALRLKHHRKFALCRSKHFDEYGVVETRKGNYLARGGTPLVSIECMFLQGKHHQLNALSMMALCEPFRIPPKVFESVLRRFKGLPHRTQEVAHQNSIRWINDSKGTNVGATLTAMESIGSQMDGKLLLISGGVGKEAEFEALAPAVEAFCSQVVLFGADRGVIAKTLLEKQPSAPVTEFETLKEAIDFAHDHAQSGDVVLFSPACASFDQFKNYEHRGECFTRWVNDLYAKKGESQHEG